MWNSLHDWFFSLGETYGVNPLIFGAIYVGAIPFFSLSVAWVVRNLRSGKPVMLPVMSGSFFFISAYLYLLVAGQNIPWWVYGILCAMVFAGVWSTVKKIRSRVDGGQVEDANDVE